MIVTFYSFKGGVGRSMALANIARWLQLRGLNVVIVDWDLEAPGLETFFSNDEAVLQSWRDRVGLTDLLLLYQQDYPAIPFTADIQRQQVADAASRTGPAERDRQSVVASSGAPAVPSLDERWAEIAADAARLRELLPPLKFSLIDVPPHAGTKDAGRLRMLTAGWREGARFSSYANAVQSFDWNDFYESFHGHAYFEWLRTSLDDPEIADIVLIDSRTGVTEMGGVSTRQLADVVVVLMAPNNQNLDGAIKMADSFSNDELIAQRGKRPIEVIMVPSRVDVAATKAKNEFEPIFERDAGKFMPKALQKLGGSFPKLRIPYASEFAFRERLSIGEPDGDRDLNKAYRSIAAYVAWLAPDSNRAKNALVDEFEDVFGRERVRSALNFGAQFEQRWQAVPTALESDVKQLLIRLVELSVTVTETDRARPLLESELLGSFREAVALAERAQLLVRATASSDGMPALALAEPEYATRSPLTKWINDDREFLSWRQGLRASLREWQIRDRDSGRLLNDSALAEAMGMMAAADANQLLDDERAFIEASISASREISSAATSDVPPPPPQAAPVAIGERFAPSAPLPMAPKRASRAWIGVAAVLFVAVAVAVPTIMSLQSTPSPLPSNAAADSLLAGRKHAADSNYVNAIVAYTAVLRLDSLSVDARRYRAEAEVASGKPERALLDLDTAVALAPIDLKLRAQRAQVRWSTRDAKAALTDLDRIPLDSMDRATVQLRADLYAAEGRDSAALGAYAAVVQRGDTAAGQLGLGRTLERLGRKPEAVQAYRVAARTAADASITTFAQARLRVLAPRDTVTSTRSIRVYLQLSARADEPLAAAIDSTLRKSGLRLALHSDGSSYELMTVRTTGEVRYFNQVDESLANRVRAATEGALAARAIYQKLLVRFISPTTQGVQSGQRTPGHIEIVLPTLSVRSKS